MVGVLWVFYRVSLKGHKPVLLPGPREARRWSKDRGGPGSQKREIIGGCRAVRPCSTLSWFSDANPRPPDVFVDNKWLAVQKDPWFPGE